MAKDTRRNKRYQDIDSSNIIQGLTVEVKGNDPKAFDRAFKLFNKKCQNAGLVKEVRARQHYTKPSEQRQIDRKAARSRHLRDLREQRKKR